MNTAHATHVERFKSSRCEHPSLTHVRRNYVPICVRLAYLLADRLTQPPSSTTTATPETKAEYILTKRLEIDRFPIIFMHVNNF